MPQCPIAGDATGYSLLEKVSNYGMRCSPILGFLSQNNRERVFMYALSSSVSKLSLHLRNHGENGYIRSYGL